MAPPEFIGLEDVTRGEGPQPSRPQSIADRLSGMMSKHGDTPTPSWDDEDFKDRRSCGSVQAVPSSPKGRRSSRLSWASDATSHADDQRTQSPVAASPRKKGSRRVGILAQVSSRFSGGRRSSRSSNASAASSDTGEEHTKSTSTAKAKSKRGVWARLEARGAATAPLGRRSWRNSRASGATTPDASEPPPKSTPATSHNYRNTSLEELEGLGKSRSLTRGTTLEEFEGFGKTALPPSPRVLPLPMSDADVVLKRQVDALIARGRTPPPPPTPTPPATLPMTAARRSARRSGVSSPYSSPMGQRRGPRVRRPTTTPVPQGASSAPGAVGGGDSWAPKGQQRHEARIQFEQGRYAESAAGVARMLRGKLVAAPGETAADFRAAVQHISYWRRPVHLVPTPPKPGTMQLGLHAARAAGFPRRLGEEDDLLAQLGLRLQAAVDAKALLDFEFAHIEPKLDLGRLLANSDTGQRSDLTATVGVLRRHFGALKRVHEAFAARNKNWQGTGGRKAKWSMLPNVLATHVLSIRELHLLIDETDMLGGGLDCAMVDVIFARCSFRASQVAPTAPLYDATAPCHPSGELLTHSRTHARTHSLSLTLTTHLHSLTHTHSPLTHSLRQLGARPRHRLGAARRRQPGRRAHAARDARRLRAPRRRALRRQGP